MLRGLAKAKSEVLGGTLANRINSGRCKTALRFSRRVRHLPPEYSNVGVKQILSQESSFQLWRKKKLHYLRKGKQSKQVSSILTASKSRNSRSASNSNAKIGKGNVPPGVGKIINKRKQYVLKVLNKGDLREIVKLPTVGSKTAQMIVLYRELKGCIARISDLAKMPKFPERRFLNFLAQNFLTTD